ncbi:uncharacterized protein LOC129593298 [Paramacrobiotus metropolitanus]|uniref:uncharacterized protein LOC129593298 n=1 Tax=Paramacrobiotus metropolitanus TaxID=2943436 RepID=UPI002445B397|nr:uncharacterized protein LOC129593298 [Paramacrobiotus metropolitanus]
MSGKLKDMELYGQLRADLPLYDRRNIDYAYHQALNLSSLEDATTVRLQEDALLVPPTRLRRMLDTEKARRVTTLMQEQEAQFLKIALKPSQLPPAGDVGGRIDQLPVQSLARPETGEQTDSKTADCTKPPSLSVTSQERETEQLGVGSLHLPTLGLRRAHFVGSEDKLTFAKPSVTFIPIITDPAPPVTLNPLTAFTIETADTEEAATKGSDVIYDDYDEKDLAELPADFGARANVSRPDGGLVDFREIFAKCYRNARRKTRAVLDQEPTITTVGDLADSRAAQLSRVVPFEPLVRDWLALLGGSVLEDVDFESMVPVLFLGLEEVVIQAQRRGLIPRDPEEPVDDVGFLDDPSFDPVEMLGAFLVRNHPKYCNAWESHPYVRSFRRVVSETRREKLNSGVKSELADIAQSAATLQKTNGQPWVAADIGAKKPNGDTFPQKSYADQPAHSFMVDGVWNGVLDDMSLMSKTQQQLMEILRIMLEWSGSAENDHVRLTVLRSSVVTFVQENKTIEYETKESIKRIVDRVISMDEVDQRIPTKDAATVLGRLLLLLQPEEQAALREHCAACFVGSEAERTMRRNRAAVGDVFDKLDEAKTGFLSRPKLLSIMEEFFQSLPEEKQAEMNNPCVWPVVPAEQTTQETEARSLPAGSTPTIFDVDDYTSLLGDAVDPRLSIPGLVQEESEKESPSREHEYVRYMYKEYPASGSTGLLRLHSQDMPDAVSNSSRETSSKAVLKRVDIADSFTRKFVDAFNERQMERKRHSNRPKQLGTVESLPYMDRWITKDQLATVVWNCCPTGHPETASALLAFIEEKYSETPDERLIRLRQEQQHARYRERNDNLAKAFDQLDTDGKGHITAQYLTDVWSTVKIPVRSADVSKALQLHQSLLSIGTSMLDRRQFVEFCSVLLESVGYDVDVGSKLLGEETVKSLKRTNAEKSRSIMRKIWLDELSEHIGTDTSTSRKKQFQAAIEVLEKDAKLHYDGRVVTVSLALLARNSINPYRGQHVLRVIAGSQSDASFYLKKIVLPDSEDIGFTVISSGEAIVIPDTADTPATLLINPQRQQVAHGPFVCHPLIDAHRRCFGVLNIDALSNKQPIAPFSDSEIGFHQGVIRIIMDGYGAARQISKVIDATATALPWFCQHLPSLKEIVVYFPERGSGQRDVQVRRVITMHSGSEAMVHRDAGALESDNPRVHYIVRAMDTAENVRTVSFGDKHIACPVLDENGLATFVLDVNFGDEWLNADGDKLLCNLLVILQKSVLELTSQWMSTNHDDAGLEIEGKMPEQAHFYVFGRLMLTIHLQPILKSVTASILADLRTKPAAPALVQQTFQAVLTLLQPVHGLSGGFATWNEIRSHVRMDLLDAVVDYDPTAHGLRPVRAHLIEHLKATLLVDEWQAAKGHPLCRYLYRWIVTNVFLMRVAQRVEQVGQAASMTELCDAYVQTMPVSGVQKPRPTFYYS